MDELMKTLEGKGDDNNADEEPADVVKIMAFALAPASLLPNILFLQNGILAVHISSIHTVQEEGNGDYYIT